MPLFILSSPFLQCDHVLTPGGTVILADGVQPAATCKRAWDAHGLCWRDFKVGCPLADAALSCTVQNDRWVAPHLAVRTLFDCVRWTCRVTQVACC